MNITERNKDIMKKFETYYFRKIFKLKPKKRILQLY